MVTFTPSMPYAEALARGSAQDRVTAIASTLDAGTHDEALLQLVRENALLE